MKMNAERVKGFYPLGPGSAAMIIFYGPPISAEQVEKLTLLFETNKEDFIEKNNSDDIEEADHAKS